MLVLGPDGLPPERTVLRAVTPMDEDATLTSVVVSRAIWVRFVPHSADQCALGPEPLRVSAKGARRGSQLPRHVQHGMSVARQLGPGFARIRPLPAASRWSAWHIARKMNWHVSFGLVARIPIPSPSFPKVQTSAKLHLSHPCLTYLILNHNVRRDPGSQRRTTTPLPRNHPSNGNPGFKSLDPAALSIGGDYGTCSACTPCCPIRNGRTGPWREYRALPVAPKRPRPPPRSKTLPAPPHARFQSPTAEHLFVGSKGALLC